MTSPNYKTTVFAPGKQVFGDATIEVNTMISSSKTSQTGDFRYGIAFRRSGDQYYAFTISPRTKKWSVLKSTPNSLEVLKEGTDEDIQDLDKEDTLRVDAQGDKLAFHINDRVVAQQVWDLAVDAAPVEGVVGVEVDAH